MQYHKLKKEEKMSTLSTIILLTASTILFGLIVYYTYMIWNIDKDTDTDYLESNETETY